jgi:hypothetical protein
MRSAVIEAAERAISSCAMETNAAADNAVESKRGGKKT